jgi:hypothetical protein
VDGGAGGGMSLATLMIPVVKGEGEIEGHIEAPIIITTADFTSQRPPLHGSDGIGTSLMSRRLCSTFSYHMAFPTLC